MKTFTKSLVVGCLLAVGFTGMSAQAGYDQNWFFADGFLPGEYPEGIAVTGDNAVIQGRTGMDMDLPRDIACALPKNAVFHPWNQFRRDSIHFATYSRIVKLYPKADFSYEVYVSGTATTLSFKQGDPIEYLVYGSEGWFNARYQGQQFQTDQSFYDNLEPINDADFKMERWMQLPCASGARAWIALDEVEGTPGLTLNWMEGGFVDYGTARDLGLTTTEINSDDASANVHVARVDEYLLLEQVDGTDAKLVVTDTGGSTDVSPTQHLYFSLYRKGEMFSTDAAFDLGPIFDFVSATKLGEGKYAVTVKSFGGPMGMPTDKTLYIDAGLGLASIRNVTCAEGFDCAESTNFVTTIFVSQ